MKQSILYSMLLFALCNIALAQPQLSELYNMSKDSLMIKDSILANKGIANETADDFESSTENHLGENQNFVAKHWTWLMGLLAASLIGYGVGFYQKRNSYAANPQPIVEDATQSHIPDKSPSPELAILQQQLNRVKNFDQLYFGHATHKLLDPFWQCIEEKNKIKLMEISLIAMAHFSSLARYKKGMDQNFDVYNLHLLTEQAQLKPNDVKPITSKTFEDDIPNQIQNIIDLLKDSGSQGLNDTSFSGYSLKEIA
jgi:hypothetical protein